MQDRIQLKREEVVGDGVALSDINPITNTKSVDDESTGASLDITIERIWAAINNRLTRIVNSVNGRDGVVVLSAEDVGLGNVSNISFSDIKDWVIEEIMQQFGFKHLHVFEDYAEFTTTMNTWAADKARANTSFYVKEGNILDANQSALPIIGYLEWDEGSNANIPHTKEINAVQFSDNSIIYNESVNGKNFNGGGIAVNIWRGEDALKLYVNDGQTIDTMPKNQSGLYIDKSKIAPKIYYFDCVYGTGVADPNAFIYADDQSVSPPPLNDVAIKINGETLSNASDHQGYFYTPRTFKINDIIITNFSDKDCRDAATGVVPAELDSLLLNREACIGQVTSIGGTPSRPLYEVNFTTLKPNVGMGLKNYSIHTGAGDTEGTILGIDLMIGTIIPGADNDNISGLNVFTSPNRSNPRISESKVHHTVTPIGDRASDANSSPSYNSLFISPDFSLNVIPYDTFGATSGTAAEFNPIKNWPTKVPELSTVSSQSFLGVNLLKKITIDPDGGAYNMSGLKILTDMDAVSNATLGKSDNDTEDKLYTSIDPSRPGELRGISGGLAVNVGKFLEIGGHVGDDAGDGYDKNHYYDGGKVNVRVYPQHFDDTDNRLKVKLSHYTKLDGTEPNMFIGGGLAYSVGFDLPSYPDAKCTSGIAINRGLGLRMSRYNIRGEIPEDYYYNLLTEEPANFDATNYYKLVDGEYVQGSAGEAWAVDTWYYRGDNEVEDHGFLAASVVDPLFLPDDFDDSYEPDDPDDPYSSKHEQIMSTYGGLRYMLGPPHGANSQSSIGLRVNTYESPYGHELRLGQRAIGINEDNVVGLQLYRESDSPSLDSNPLIIKGWDEASLYKYVKMPWMTNIVYVNTLVDLEATADPSVNDNTHFSEYPSQYKYTPVVPVTNGVPPIITYHDWPSAGIYYMINDSSYTEVTVVGKGTLLEPYKPIYEDNKYFTRSDISPSYVRRTDTIYYVKETQHRYIWNPTDNEYQRMFVELNDEAALDELTPNKNKAYIILTMNTVQHKIWGKLVQWQEANPVHIPFSHIHGTDPPEYDDSKAINATTASYILSYYASKAISNHPKGYFIASDNQFHYGPSASSEIIPASEGVPYEDIATKLLYKYDGSSYKTIDLINGENITQYDLAPADVNQDGHINAIDASIVLSYYAIRSTGDSAFPAYLINDPNTTERDLFAYYLKTYENVEERLTSDYVTMRETDENGSFIPGLDININEHQGLTTVLQGDIKKAVSVKLFDPSAGYETTDKYAYLKRGGLRFTTDGYLSVRVNHLNTYDATSLDGRDASDVNSQDADGKSLENAGTKGLMIYGDNVLGIQLSSSGASDNGELYFDEYGNLRAHATGGGGGELLTITDGTNTITYNGSTAQTITLGPGLMIEPDPTPNP